MQLYCLNPVRILVGNWFDILSSTSHCLFNSNYYPLSKFHPDFVNYFTAGRLDKSKAKRFYSGDWQLFDSDGCPLTLFQDVPCGKCTCCVDKKAMDWAFRAYRDWETDRKSTRLNSSHSGESRMPSSA